MPILLRLALRNLLRHRWRTFATVLGVALGIAAVLATLSVGRNVRANLAAELQAATGTAELLVTPGPGGRAVIELDPLLEAVAGTPGVAAFEPVLNRRAEPLRDVGEVESTVVPGVDTGFQLSGRRTDRPDRLPAELEAGRWPRPGEEALALSGNFAASRDIAVGDTVAFATRFGELPLEVVGLLDPGVGLANTNGGRVAIAPLGTLQRAFRLEGRVSHLAVLTEEGALTADVEAALARRVDERWSVVHPAVAGELAGGIVDTLQSGLLVLAVTLLALGGFMAYNTFMAGVVERAHEYALLRTVCMRRRDVQRLAILEAALVSVAGAVAGIALGVALSWLITRINAYGLNFEVHTLVVPLPAVAAAVTVGVAVAMLAGTLPALAARATAPAAARRQAEAVTAPQHAAVGWGAIGLAVVLARIPWSGPWAVAAAGAAMAAFAVGTALAAGTILAPAVRLARRPLRLLLGVPGALGAGFTARNASRNGVAIGTVVVGTGLVVGVGAMVGGINAAVRDWVDTTVVGDLFVSSPVSFPDDFRARAEALEGIDQASGVGIRVVRYQPEGAERGRSVAMLLVDPERFHPETGFGSFQFVDGGGDARAAYEALRDGGEVLAASTLQERYGVRRGDTIRLRTADGFAPFEVAGVVVDFTGGGETVVASTVDTERFGGGEPDLFVLTVEEGAAAEAARMRLEGAFPDLHLDVTSNAAYRARILELTERTFLTTNTLLVLAVLIAALGVANTLGMNLTARARELATLRVLGLGRGGVRRVVIGEGMVVLTVGSVAGIAFGLLLADVVTSGAAALTGYRLEAVLPWRLVAIALAASPAVGMVASLLPAHRAARLAPMMALRGTE